MLVASHRRDSLALGVGRRRLWKMKVQAVLGKPHLYERVHAGAAVSAVLAA